MQGSLGMAKQDPSQNWQVMPVYVKPTVVSGTVRKFHLANVVSCCKSKRLESMYCYQTKNVFEKETLE